MKTCFHVITFIAVSYTHLDVYKRQVTDKPEEAVKKFQGGSIRYQTEAKFPLLHQAAGKLSFTDEQLVKNITVLVEALKKKNISSMYLSATMTPSVKVDVEAI